MHLKYLKYLKYLTPTDPTDAVCTGTYSDSASAAPLPIPTVLASATATVAAVAANTAALADKCPTTTCTTATQVVRARAAVTAARGGSQHSVWERVSGNPGPPRNCWVAEAAVAGGEAPLATVMMVVQPTSKPMPVSAVRSCYLQTVPGMGSRRSKEIRKGRNEMVDGITTSTDNNSTHTPRSDT